MNNKSTKFSLFTIIFLISFLAISKFNIAHAGLIEDIIKKHSFNTNIEKDRCNLAWMIFHDYLDIFNSDQVERYDVIIGNNFDHAKNDVIWSVGKDKKNVVIASFYDTDIFYILKLKNGKMISDKDGYFVPFDEFEIANKQYKSKSNLVILQKTPPKDKIKYFSSQNCEVTIVNNN